MHEIINNVRMLAHAKNGSKACQCNMAGSTAFLSGSSTPADDNPHAATPSCPAGQLTHEKQKMITVAGTVAVVLTDQLAVRRIGGGGW